MQIAINSIRENHNDRTVFWTLTDDSDTEYQWHSDIPLGGEAQDHLDRATLVYLLLIRKREYPTLTLDRDYVIDPSQTELEAIEEWIEDGRRLRNDQGQYTGEILDPLPWKSTHPVVKPLITEEQAIALDASKSVKHLKEVLKSIYNV